MQVIFGTIIFHTTEGGRKIFDVRKTNIECFIHGSIEEVQQIADIISIHTGFDYVIPDLYK